MTNIVLFKSESDGPDKFVEILKKHNFNVQSITSIDFRFKNLDKLKAKLRNFDDYNGIILTSPRAIIATQQSIVNEDDKVMRAWIDKRNYTVGESTHNLAKTLLNINTKGKEAGNAQKLSDLIIEDYKQQGDSKPFLFPSGNLKQDILEKNFNKHSIELESIEIYDTIPHADLEDAIQELRNSYIDFIVYFSPSSIKFSLPFFKKHEIDLSKIKLIAIGPSTKRCLEENNLECFKMCDKPNPESLLNAL